MDKRLFWSLGVLIVLLISLVILISLSGEQVPPESTYLQQEDNSWAPSRCVLIGDFNCDNYTLDKAGYLSLALSSTEDTLVTSIEVKSTPRSRITCNDKETNIEFSKDEQKVLTFSCGDSSIGELDAEITIKYTRTDSGISKLLIGDLMNLEAFD